MLRNKLVLGLIVTFTMAHPNCSKRPIRYRSAIKISKVVKQLHKSTGKFDAALREELRKTEIGGVAFRKYNPELIPRLRDALELIDLANPKAQVFLRKNVWTCKFRSRQDAEHFQSRLHLYFSHLLEVGAAVRTAVAIEVRLHPVLKEVTTGDPTLVTNPHRTAAQQVALDAYAETIRAISRALKKSSDLQPGEMAKQLRWTNIESNFTIRRSHRGCL